MSTTAEVTARPTLPQIWSVLGPLLNDSWSVPVNVSIHSDRLTMAIQYPDNDRAAVDAAFAVLQTKALAQFDASHYWSEGVDGNDGEFAVYGSFRRNRRDPVSSPLLPNVELRIYCHIRTRADASAHWDGLILHAVAGLVAS